MQLLGNMSHYISSKPFYVLTGTPSGLGFLYGCNEVGREIAAPDIYPLQEFDTEQELADLVDALIEEPGWYYRCENRIPYPPNPNVWSTDDCE